jgi:extracellular matrix regulatory protein A
MMVDRSFAMFDAGFGNMVPKARVIGLVAYDSDPIHRHTQELEKMHRVIDATKGRKVKTVVFLDSSHVVLSAVARETLCERIAGERVFVESSLPV